MNGRAVSHLLQGVAGTADEAVDRVKWNTDHGAERQTKTEGLGPPGVGVGIIVSKKAELRPHPNKDSL